MSAQTYRLTRGLARFATARNVVVAGRRATTVRATRAARAAHRSGRTRSPFAAVDVPTFTAALRRDGWAPGLTLPEDDVASILEYATTATMYADRDPSRGFRPDDRELAEQRLGKPILVAQHLNARRDSAVISQIAADPVLWGIATDFLGAPPRLVGSSLWWTFPVDPTEEDRDQHAHLFHRDVDDFAFLKFFFYISDVEPADGAHVLVQGSHRRPPLKSPADRLRLRRYTDAEIGSIYPAEDILEITGPAGTGFAENTLCVHKGRTPTRHPRLLLQFEFALFDHGVMDDAFPDSELALLVEQP